MEVELRSRTWTYACATITGSQVEVDSGLVGSGRTYTGIQTLLLDNGDHHQLWRYDSFRSASEKPATGSRCISLGKLRR